LVAKNCVHKCAMQYSDSAQYQEDIRYVDTRLPYMVVPSFLQWPQRSIGDSPSAYKMMVKSFPWTGPGVLACETISYDPDNRFKYPYNAWLSKRYDFNTQRCLYKGKEWLSSEAMLVWHLGNGYRLNALSCDPITHKEVSPGYFYLSLVYRHKDESNKPRSGVRDLVKLLRYLALMPGAPPAVFYEPQAVNSGASPHLEHLEYERALNTEQLTKLWHRALDGVRIPGTPYWFAGIYKPERPAVIDPQNKSEKFEKVLAEMKKR
jgi:hypothetical protein